MRKLHKVGNGHKNRTSAKALKRSFLGVQQYIEQVPAVRWDKVSDVRQQLSSGCWQPVSEVIVDKILYEHLIEPS